MTNKRRFVVENAAFNRKSAETRDNNKPRCMCFLVGDESVNLFYTKTDTDRYYTRTALFALSKQKWIFGKV